MKEQPNNLNADRDIIIIPTTRKVERAQCHSNSSKKFNIFIAGGEEHDAIVSSAKFKFSHCHDNPRDSVVVGRLYTAHHLQNITLMISINESQRPAGTWLLATGGWIWTRRRERVIRVYGPFRTRGRGNSVRRSRPLSLLWLNSTRCRSSTDPLIKSSNSLISLFNCVNKKKVIIVEAAAI